VSPAPFPSALLQTGRDTFASTGFSVVGGVFIVRVGRPAWMSEWQSWQTTSVFRCRAAMTFIQFGFSGWPLRLRFLRALMWWTCICSRDPQSSQVSAMSRCTISVPRSYVGIGSSGMVALVSRTSDVSPHVATNGFFPGHATMTRRALRGPPSVSKVTA
jgi:hypothetical protein